MVMIISQVWHALSPYVILFCQTKYLDDSSFDNGMLEFALLQLVSFLTDTAVSFD